PIESALASIWSEVLKVPQVGVLDSFFELGGHSLLATQVMSRVRTAFAVELPLQALFETPTIEALARRIEAKTPVAKEKPATAEELTRRINSLSPEKRAEFLQKVAAQRATSGAPTKAGIPLADRNQKLLASYSQQRLWLLDQLAPGSAAYNLPIALRMSGALDVEALRRSIETLVHRHEALRTTFREDVDGAVQIITPPTPLPMELIDLRSLPQAERDARVERISETEAQQPFSLATGPLLRTTLVVLGPQEHLLLLNIHHIVSDGWSHGVIVREVARLYQAYAMGQPSPLAALPIQYADHAVNQRKWLDGGELESQLSWWREHLKGAPTALELPTDRPRTQRDHPAGEHVFVEFSTELSKAVEAFCRREGITPFMFLLGSFQLLMARYSGQEDICVGTPIAGRDHPDLEGLVGFFTNTVVLRTRLDGDPTVRELLHRVRTSTLATFAHQHVPYEKLQPMRDLRQAPLFQVMFILQNMPPAELSVPGLTLRPVTRLSNVAKFDLTLTLSHAPRGFVGELEYDAGLFDAATVERMMGHLRELISALMAAPERRLSAVTMLSLAERRQVLVDWNATRAPFPDTCVHSLFEAQVRRAPEALAATYEGQHLTYAQLDARANQLAHALRRRGVGPEVRVALSVERSLDIVIGLLGILKSGGAWVPLDPLLPRERLTFMLEDSGAAALVTQSSLRERFPEAFHAKALFLDQERESLATEPTEAPTTGVTSGHMAYLLYTSGSTGTPKGTAVEHRAVANLVTHEATVYGIAPGSRVLQFASLSFDLSVEEIFTTLCNGASLVLAPLDKLMPGAPLPALLRAENLSVISLTPAALAATPADDLPALRTVISGGEALPADVVARWAPGRRLINSYGPTEATVVATLGESVPDGRVPSIGRPLANVRAYVLDTRGQPVPVGVRGELYVGGVGVARGYAGRPALTAERFVPDMFSGETGARLYRTGDVVRWREDGTLDFVGRVDAQVKVRGFRIELGEIESALRTAPTVRDAVVVAREDSPGDKRLVAYVVTSSTTGVDVIALREHLRRSLPEYMVPAAYVALEVLPLTSNGKVDRRALPAPEASQLRSSQPYEAPLTPLEEQLAEQWREILRVPVVGRRENFFELGGHSLLATQLVARIRATFGVELPLRALFEAPTVAAIAERLQVAKAGASRPPLKKAVHDGPPRLSFAQQRLWFLDQLSPGDASYNLPVALRLLGPVDAEALRRAFEFLVLRHEALRTTFAEEQGQPFQRIHSPSRWELNLVDLRSRPESEREDQARQRVLDEARRPFDLVNGPLLRTVLLRLADESHVLVVTMHHIVSDGWSMGVLVRDLAASYSAFSAGREPRLPALPVQYADFAAWQREWLQGEALDAQLTYWKQQLSGAPSALELPTDRPRPPVQSHRGATVPVQVPPALAESLKALAQREGATPFMLLLAAFQLLMARYSGQDDVNVGSPIAGRTHEEAEGLIGFFVNTLVLRARVKPRASFRELLAQVRTTSLAAHEHQHLPFEKLVEVLQPVRDLSRSPLFQVVFVLQNAPAEALRVQGVSFQAFPLEGNSAKFDLTLSLDESPRGFTGNIEYSTQLFDASTVQRMAGHLGVLLEAIVQQPDTSVAELPLLTASEREQLLVAWNDTRVDFASNVAIHQVVAEQARRAPQAQAIHAGAKSLTYAELDEASNRLAAHLRELGVTRGARVAICAERSVELITGLLAILKAGGAYVPIAPSSPPERLAFMVEDSGATVLLTQEHLLANVPPLAARVVRVDAELPAAPRMRDVVGAEDLAYVIYTSGSTGRPKGVAVHHRGLMNLVSWHQRSYALGAEDRTALTAGVAFDASTWEIWPPLASGGSLRVPPESVRADPAQLLGWIANEAITVSFMPTPMAEAVLREPWPASIALRALLTGGDALHHAPPASVSTTLYNHYGPTESTVVATATPVAAGASEGGRPPIGRPIANTRAYVLDANLHLVPVGVPGELFLDSEGLAWGYLGQPALTAERFVPHPFASVPGARLYRTGDQVRWRTDGQLDYLQRLDFQVKVRGFRIELGEIEATLLSHPSVHETVVLAREDVPGDKRLVAYVAPRANQTLEVEALRAHLQQQLPEYMVPSAFVVLEALPVTANGKLDRKALPAPDASLTASAYVAPRTLTEEKLAAVFAEVLRVERVGIHDDFFALGGHSLLATQLVSRVRSVFAVEMALRVLFEAPTVATLALKLDAAPGSRVQAPPLRAVPRDGALPLSFAQQRLWLLDQLTPGDASYNIPSALRLTGSVEVEALRRAFEALVHRHESLRTTFVEQEGEPTQVIHPAGTWALSVTDLSALPESEREAEALRHATREAQTSFNLAAGPLLRTALVRLAPQEHLLLVTMHHIVSDGWSMGVLVRELAAAYAAFTRGAEPQWTPMAVQYADFAAWQRQWLQGEALDTQLAYWKQQLSGAPSVLELPTDRPRPPVQTHRGAAVSVQLPLALSESLKALAQREGATPFMLLLAAFHLQLARYSGQDDISVGTPIAGRTHGETEGLIGFFVNTLVLRAQVRPHESFRELLGQVRTTTLSAYEHQHLPFERLVEVLQPVRDLSRSALFQVMFTLQNTPTEALRMPGLSFQALTQESQTSKFDLTLALQETRDGFAGTFEYNTDLFDPATLQRMAGHLNVLLEAIVARPDASLSSLPLLTAPERRQLLGDWNNTRADYPRDTLIHHAFAEQAARTPDALAVLCREDRLSFRELDAKANQLAHRLRELGVGPDVRVVLCVERSVEALVGILGTLKAGGGYVPIDPSYPKEWLAHVLQDTGTPVVLTQRRLVAALPPHAAQDVCLDDDDTYTGRPTHVPAVPVAPENLAYVIYTSGSTGRPKGVMIQHRSVLNLRLALARTVHAEARVAERVSVNAPLSFDASVKQLIQVLDGHALCIVPEEARGDVRELVRRIGKDALDVLDCSPAHLRLLVDEGLLEQTNIPRRVLVGGEAVDTTTWRHLGENTRMRVFNVYGPTECTVDATACAFDSSDVPTIGRPLPNVRAYVLDAHFQPVPVGVAGELFIGGEGLARGYLGRPDLTADRFMPDAFTPTPGARMYRTGDRVRWRTDGTLEYQGRIDFQVKVRGFRIELGEVEATLLTHPAVHEAVVLAREDVPGDKRLVAYVVAEDGQTVDTATLRAHLKDHLPEYMVPSAFVTLEALPLNTNGKLDRKALPAPDVSQPASTYVAPSTPSEEKLAALFAQVLRLERVGVHDDFFALGGHSLLATQLVSRVRAAFRAELPLRALFEAPTVAALAARLDGDRNTRVQAPPLVPVPRAETMPLSFAQQRLWLLDQLEPGSASYNLPAGLRLRGTLDVEALRRAFEALVVRHEALRTTFTEQGGQPAQRIHAARAWPLPITDLSSVPAEQREAQARAMVASEARRPFDLTHGPLLRTSLVRLDTQEHLLLVTMHHIVSDGWSMGVLVQELASLYAAFSTGIEPRLAPLPVQYADFASWQRQWLQGEALEAQLGYWRQQLSGAPPALELPTDKARPPVQSHRGGDVSLTFSSELTESLKALAQREGATPFMVLLAAFQVLLSRYAAQDDISVGSPIAGRTHAETEGLIGFFVNTLVLRARMTPEMTFRELLAQVRTTTLSAYDHQHVPFEKLVEILQPARDLSRSPLFQVMFALQNAPAESLRMPGLSFQPLPLDGYSAKFDLTLALQESPRGLVGTLEYSTDLFEQRTIARMGEHLRILLDG
ncbi:non-ribosomal peptide synthetase, partial [Corallococcus sp. H22C18031201]